MVFWLGCELAVVKRFLSVAEAADAAGSQSDVGAAASLACPQ